MSRAKATSWACSRWACQLAESAVVAVPRLCHPSRLARKALGPGRPTHSGEAPRPLTTQWRQMGLLSARACLRRSFCALPKCRPAGAHLQPRARAGPLQIRAQDGGPHAEECHAPPGRRVGARPQRRRYALHRRRRRGACASALSCDERSADQRSPCAACSCESAPASTCISEGRRMSGVGRHGLIVGPSAATGS